jgi:uroporphyrinogen-III synthase
MECTSGRLLNLILMKSSVDEARDKYVDFIQANNAHLKILNQIKLINCLEFEFIAIDTLKAKLDLMFTTDAYTTLVLTSGQAIEAMKNLDEIASSPKGPDSLVDVYCVGEQTKAAFETLIDQKFPYLKYSIGRIVTPGQFNRKQNGLELAKQVLDDYKSTRFSAFFPCSSIRKPDLVDLLHEANYKVDELFVYKTCKSVKGLIELKTFLLNVDDKCVNLVAFFSPSCVNAFFDLFSDEQMPILRLKFFFINIGPSTSSRFVDCIESDQKFKSFRHTELDEPTPAELLKKVLLISES